MPWKHRRAGRWRIDRRRAEVIFCVAVGLPLTAFFVATRVPYPIERLNPPPRAALVVSQPDGTPLRTFLVRPAWVSLDRVAPIVVQATLAGEDHRFYEHRGVDGVAVLRALWLAASHGRVKSGGSTITMQLVRLAEPHRRTLRGKLGEMVDACRLERAVSKAEILEQYLNRAYYGNGAWGIEAAAQRYFGKTAADLSAGEGALLAVLPRAPQDYDPYRHRAQALERRGQVLTLMEKHGWIDGVGRAAAEAQAIVLSPPRRRPTKLGELVFPPGTFVKVDRPTPAPADGDEPAATRRQWSAGEGGQPPRPPIEPPPRAPRIDPVGRVEVLAKIQQHIR